MRWFESELRPNCIFFVCELGKELPKGGLVEGTGWLNFFGAHTLIAYGVIYIKCWAQEVRDLTAFILLCSIFYGGSVSQYEHVAWFVLVLISAVVFQQVIDEDSATLWSFFVD